MKADETRPLRLAVIGGGLTGAAFIIHAARAAACPLVIHLIEPASQIGRGLAYGTVDPSHRINVPSDRMSLFPDDPHHLTQWLEERGILPDPASTDPCGHHYVPRQAYGDYVADTVKTVLASADARVKFRHHEARATSLSGEGQGWRVALSEGSSVVVDRVVLCCGHAAPAVPAGVPAAAWRHPGFVADPWARDALDAVGPADSVLIVGTGLTMADVVASLDRRGHTGPVTAISRRGLLARPHGLFLSDVDVLDGRAPPETALALLRLVRRRVRDLGPAIGWQPVMDALRFALPRIWPSLPPREQRRVMRRLLPFWEVHRFRVAPQIHDIVVRAIESGRLSVETARFEGLNVVDSRLAASVKPYGQASETRVYDRIVLCTGPANRLKSDPLLAAILERGQGRPDAVGMGLQVDGSSRLVAPDGAILESLIVLGPLTRGSFGEMTGAPDIIQHIRRIAPGIVRAAAPPPHPPIS